MSKIYNPQCRSADLFESSQILDMCTHTREGTLSAVNDKPVIF